jgi:hypothetical protein
MKQSASDKKLRRRSVRDSQMKQSASDKKLIPLVTDLRKRPKQRSVRDLQMKLNANARRLRKPNVRGLQMRLSD